ncbi:MAG TPA: hypothetical protein VL547_07825 [Dinghuibacter sp.]|uniref:anti-sigma factor family protein n=1 Tax=Dinghuibacter sp. TaxID=2024697 RepID=UPI002B6E9C76|nr:hypothetical protein [Dinghuibacter sp.]HTJ11917.1 hypothetical protein [Dinghuibacter sp.]
MEDRLWDYIDGRATPAEREEIEALLASDPALREQYAELLSIHAVLQGADIEEPSLRFTKNVMEAVAGQSVAPATPTYVNKRVIRGITIALLSLLGATFAYVLVLLKLAPSVEKPTPGLQFDVPQVSIPDLHLDPYLSSFIFIAILSAFVWIDAWHQRRRKTAAHPQD